MDLTANAPETSDATFTWEQFQAQVNADLADVLGNFVNRICKFTETRFEGVVPDGRRARRAGGRSWKPTSLAKLRELTGHMEDREFRKAPGAAPALGAGQRVPDRGRALDGDQDRPRPGGRGGAHGLNLAALFAKVSEPFIPFAAEKIAAGAGRGRSRRRGRRWTGRACCQPWSPAAPIQAPEVLFRKVEDAQVAEWRERFGGPETAAEPA